MLGGVIVNLILGFMIYMMILFVWGKDTLTTEAIPNGMEVSELAQKVGFLNGDKILSVDGQVLDNVLMINKDLFLRSVQEVDVMRADGTKKTLQIPEDFGSQMFESGDLRPFSLVSPSSIEVQADSPAEASGLLTGDVIINANGVDINSYTFLLKEQIGRAHV